VQFKLHDGNYAQHREGAFYETSSIADLPRMPKVSVLIRSIGRRRLARQALTTVANQTYPNVEVVLVEDGPATLTNLVAEFPELQIVYVPLGKRMGRCVAGNEALERASGEYFVFLDDDDGFYADHLEQLVRAVLTTGQKVAYSWAFEVPTRYALDGERVLEEGPYASVFKDEFSWLELFHHNYLPINTVLFHRSLYENCGGFDLELKNLEDWNLWVRYAVAAGPFALVPKTTAFYRVPLDPQVVIKRHADLDASLPMAFAKQEHLRLEVGVTELLDEYERLVGTKRKRTDVIGRVLDRYPVLERPAAVVYNALNRLVA
jgi:hypothetical protein